MLKLKGKESRQGWNVTCKTSCEEKITHFLLTSLKWDRVKTINKLNLESRLPWSLNSQLSDLINNNYTKVSLKGMMNIIDDLRMTSNMKQSRLSHSCVRGFWIGKLYIIMYKLQINIYMPALKNYFC